MATNQAGKRPHGGGEAQRIAKSAKQPSKNIKRIGWRHQALAWTAENSAESRGPSVKVSTLAELPATVIGIAVDSHGTVYVACFGSKCIKKVASDGTISTLPGTTAGQPGVEPFEFRNVSSVVSVAVGSDGTLYSADDDRICRITVHGTVSTLAGGSSRGFIDASGQQALFNSPYGVSVDGHDTVYVADVQNHCIRKVTSDGTVSTLAGSENRGYANGAGTEAKFLNPTDVAVGSDGTLYVSDSGNNAIRKITSDGTVSTLAGSEEPGFADGVGFEARFKWPYFIAVDKHGTVYVSDTGNNRVRMITPDGTVSTLAGTGEKGFVDNCSGLQAQFHTLWGITVDDDGSVVHVIDRDDERCCVRTIRIRPCTAEPPPPCSSSTFNDDLAPMVNSERFSDVVFRVQGERFFGHCMILCARSKYFESMLLGKFTEGAADTRAGDAGPGGGGRREVDIQEASPEVFLEVLRFVYTDECDMESSTAMELLELATRFALDQLVWLCSLELRKAIDCANVCSMLVASDRLSAPVLREACVTFVCRNMDSVRRTRAWKDLKEMHAALGCEVLERCFDGGY